MTSQLQMNYPINRWLTPFAIVMFCCLFFPASLPAQQTSQADVKSMVNADARAMPYNIPGKPEDISPLLTGEQIPALTLQDASGTFVDLGKAVAQKPTILIIYRGGWCPFCSRQLSGLQQIAPDLEKEGYQIIAISTDNPQGLQQSQAKEKLGYTLLSDADLTASKRFGLAYKAPENYWDMLKKSTAGKDTDLLLPVPSVFILDTKGTIHFEYINPDFKQRISPELLMAAARIVKKDF